ncbi:G5 domain-containing protein [Paraoerskovia marina]|uniref:aggregation-promoting factor C-terminal-like domain-containing protein n=1 Tax=Paraoerskovia marina TaxID=545619 RepID=UPI0006949331|nr:G5 domain-containing protein [Paraoerskovia marina]
MKHIPAHRQNSARPKDAHTESITIDGTEPAPRHPRRRKAVALVASAFVLAGGGTAAYASTVKTVDLDVDGKTTTVTTAAGSVGGVLASEGIDVDTRDLVAPGVDTALEDGDEIVVRTADEVTIEQDGDERSILTTSVDADETIERYSERAGEDVRLVASRSDADGRAELPIELDTDAPVTVEADGDSVEVDDSQDVDTVLDEAGVELGDADRVVVEHDDSDAETPVSVVVERVESSEEERTETVDFESTTVEDPDMYVGESEVRTEGEAGERTIVEDVVTRDGEEISREEVSNEVTTEPVDEVIAEGSKELPGGTPASNKELGLQMAAERGWTGSEATCLDSLWTRESGWDENAANPTSSAFGIPQALPGSKMASAGSDWATNPATQIAWGLDYIAGSYGTPCSAWAHSESVGWY